VVIGQSLLRNTFYLGALCLWLRDNLTTLVLIFQVVLVLLLGQRVALTNLMRGDHCIGKLADYTTQFIGDHIADFIIRNGGWVRLS
jgi:hypothetical protein